MQLTHVFEHNAFHPDNHSGTPYWIIQGLRNQNIQLNNMYISPAERLLPPWKEFAFQARRLWIKGFRRNVLCSDLYLERAYRTAEVIQKRLSNVKADAVLATITPVSTAFLETKIPIVYWTDAVHAALADFYPCYRNFHSDTSKDSYYITNGTLMNARLLIFSSDWAARTAVEFYGISREKIKVVPFGANLEITHDYSVIKEIIAARSRSCIKLLFVGRDWYRKGGDIAVLIAEQLHRMGQAVELTVVGCDRKEKWPSYIKCIPFLSKSSQDDINKLEKIYRESHFLLLPTRADCTPIVFAEANAFGVPCITTYIGGIPTVVKDDINGKMFSVEQPLRDACDYILNNINEFSKYENLALSSFNEYQTRLNWQVACHQVKKLIADIL